MKIFPVLTNQLIGISAKLFNRQRLTVFYIQEKESYIGYLFQLQVNKKIFLLKKCFLRFSSLFQFSLTISSVKFLKYKFLFYYHHSHMTYIQLFSGIHLITEKYVLKNFAALALKNLEILLFTNYFSIFTIISNMKTNPYSLKFNNNKNVNNKKVV